MADRRSGATPGGGGLNFIAVNPAMEAYNEGEKAAIARKAAELAIEGVMQSQAENRASAPSRLRTITATSDLTRANADVAQGTVPYKIDDAYQGNRSNRANADVNVRTVDPRVSQQFSAADTAASGARTAGSNANVAVATEGNRITQSNDATRTGTAGANVAVATAPNRITDANNTTRTGTAGADVAVATAPDKIAGSRIGLRQQEATALNSELASLYKQLDLLNAGRVDEAKMLAQAAGREIPQPIIDNAELRATLTAVVKKAGELYPNRPKDQQAFIQSHMETMAQGASSASPATPHTMPPGAPALQEDTSRSYFEWRDGTGPDPANPGKMVPGRWKVDRYAGTEEFTPGATGGTIAPTGRAGGAKDPASVATAKWLVQNGVAPSEAAAWEMVNTSKSNPAAMYTSVYNAALRANFGNAAKAKQTADQWRVVDQQNRAMAPARPGTTPPAAAPPQAAIRHLLANPSLAAQFDQKYGAGAAQRALGQ